MSVRAYSAPEIAAALSASADWVRRVIRDFNRLGLEALLPAWSGGRPRPIDERTRARIVEIMDTHPQELGEPYATWSLSRLGRYLARTGWWWCRRNTCGASCWKRAAPSRRPRAWKSSPDPAFAVEAARLRRLYRVAETGCLQGVLVCFDEHGPVTPTPKRGRGWPQLPDATIRFPGRFAYITAWSELPEEHLFARGTVDRVREIASGLSTNQRQVLILRDVEGLAASEVCELLGLSEGNQRVLLHRARSRVRAALEAELGVEA